MASPVPCVAVESPLQLGHEHQLGRGLERLTRRLDSDRGVDVRSDGVGQADDVVTTDRLVARVDGIVVAGGVREGRRV